MLELVMNVMIKVLEVKAIKDTAYHKVLKKSYSAGVFIILHIS